MAEVTLHGELVGDITLRPWPDSNDGDELQALALVKVTDNIFHLDVVTADWEALKTQIQNIKDAGGVKAAGHITNFISPTHQKCAADPSITDAPPHIDVVVDEWEAWRPGL